MYYNKETAPKAWYNKLGIYKVYEELDLKDFWFHISLSSHDDEDDLAKGKYNFLTLAFGSTYKKFQLPFQLIKPIFDYNSYEYSGDDYYQKSQKWFRENNCPIKYKFYKVNKYKFSVSDGTIFIDLNHADDLLYNEGKHKSFSKVIWVPWKHRTRSKEQFLNLDGTVFFDSKDSSDWDEQFEKQKEQEYRLFVLRDYDGAEVEVECRRSYCEYSVGSSKFWINVFKPFTKPSCYHYLDLNFRQELGTGKETWKGGIISTSIELLHKDELFEDALNRFGQDKRNKFVLISERIENENN